LAPSPLTLTNGHASDELAPRDDTDVADEEVVISSSADVYTDTDDVAAEKAAEKMIERRMQVCRYYYPCI